MTCLEHLIENCLHSFETTDKTPDEILAGIKGDINLHYSGITAEQCYEICQYVFTLGTKRGSQIEKRRVR